MAIIVSKETYPLRPVEQGFDLSHDVIVRAYSSAYPDAPFPGVSPERLDISHKGNPPKLPRDLEAFAVKLTQKTNALLAQEAENLQPGESGEHMTMYLKPPETEAIIADTVNTAYAAAMMFPDTEIITPPAGGTPLAILLNYLGVPLKRIHSMDIKGTSGMSTGRASVDRDELPVKIRRENSISLLVEDLPDSGGSTAAAALAILQAKYPTRYREPAARALREDLVTANGNGNDGMPVYMRLARVCATAGLVPEYAVTKNPQFTEALRQTVNEFQGVDPRWNTLMNFILEHHAGTPIPNFWGIGIFDTGVVLSRLRKRFADTPLRNHALFTEGIVDENNQWLTRLGQIPGIAYLDKSKNHEEHIVDLEADVFREMAVEVTPQRS